MTIQNAFGSLRSIYVRPPRADDGAAWREFGWHQPPDPVRAEAEHAAFRFELERSGADVVIGASPVPGDPDAIYPYDPVLLTDRGAVLLRPGKPARRREPEAVGVDLQGAGVTVLGALEAPATAEGGDMFWLDERTLLVGRGYRTNDDGIAQLGTLLGPGVELVVFDLPHFLGPTACLHLLSFISPLDRDLAVGFVPMMPVRLVELLNERDVSLVEVPEEEFESQGPNVLALGPRVALALDGNPETRTRMERAGVDVRTFVGDEISRKGDGGPTCLSRPLDRA